MHHTSLISYLAMKPFSRQHLACPCEHLQISVKVEVSDFGAGASFLVRMLSVHKDIEPPSLCTLMLVFQQFPVHCSLEPCCFLSILTSSSEDDSLHIFLDLK